MDRSHLFKYFSFDSISKIRDINSYKEWVGETDKEVVVIVYKGAELSIGIGSTETRARCNIEKVGQGCRPDPNINLTKINQQLELEWVLPSGFLDE